MNDTKAIFKSIFEKMIDAGLLIAEDPDMLALTFTALGLYCRCEIRGGACMYRCDGNGN